MNEVEKLKGLLDSKDTFGNPAEMFEAWWDHQGRRVATEEPKEIARAAFAAGLFSGGNYVADDEIAPEKFTFANGAVVTVGFTADGGAILLLSRANAS